MKRLLTRLALGLVVVVVVFVLGGAMYFDSVLKASVESGAPKLTKSEVHLDAIGLSLVTGSGRAVGFELGNPVGFGSLPAFRCDSTLLNLKPSSLLGDKLVLNRLNLEAAEVIFEGTLGTNNLQALLANVDAALTNTTGEVAPVLGAGRRLEVHELLILGAKIHVLDPSAEGGRITLDLPEIRLTDLGLEEKGISGGELTRLVLHQIHERTLTAVAAQLTKQTDRHWDRTSTNHPLFIPPPPPLPPN